jgi:osmotically-inducible protein OsmY
MRRKYFGLAIAAFATLGPLQAWGGDREIAEQIIQRLKSTRDSGALKDFTLDMKVDQGVVLFRGNVSHNDQKELVLSAAQGVEGIVQVRDEVSVNLAAAQVVNPKAEVSVDQSNVGPMHQNDQEFEPELVASAVEKDFSFREALTAQAQAVGVADGVSVDEAPSKIRRTAAVEPVAIDPVAIDSSPDQQVVSAVVSALSEAKNAGQLKGFGVDVQSNGGVLQLTGRASSAAQRNTIIQIAEQIPGVAGIREAIAIPTTAPNAPLLPQRPQLTPLSQAQCGVPANYASGPVGLPAMTAPYRTQSGLQTAAIPSGVRGPIAGQPVPMGPYTPVGAPRYDSPNLPNYAWPGYAAHPNYAAVTYPQQYSPSAWPYIGPFYPYPQVPLGWRKVSLEWDDGWWFLDFTDK